MSVYCQDEASLGFLMRLGFGACGALHPSKPYVLSLSRADCGGGKLILRLLQMSYLIQIAYGSQLI